MSDKLTKVLTAKEEKLLKKQGFQLSFSFYPHQVEDSPKQLGKEERRWANWTRSVACNQDDEIDFLLKNRISFTADIHYGHRSMIYDGKTDVLLIAQNFGKQIQMWGDDKMNFTVEVEPVQRTTGKEYLKPHKLYRTKKP